MSWDAAGAVDWREVEARAGVEPIERLQARRAALVTKAAPLRAMRDTFDARRKERRAAIAALIVHEQGGRDIPENRLERMSSGDPRYKQFLDEAELAFAQLVVLEQQIDAVTERINRGQALLRYLASEPK